MSTYPSQLAKPLQIRKALGLYRVMAVVAGIVMWLWAARRAPVR